MLLLAFGKVDTNNIVSQNMTLMKTILVPTNFTDVGKNALSYATILAQKLKAKITLIHAYPNFTHPTEDAGQVYHKQAELFKKEAEQKLKSLCEEVESTSSCTSDFINVGGVAKEVIVSYANETKPDILVIGTESLSPIDRIIFGTITGKVMKEVDCPLLIVPEDVPYKPFQKLAFAIDYHDSDVEEIRFVEKLADKFAAEVHVIHVVADDENIPYEERFFEYFKKNVLKAAQSENITFKLIRGGNIVSELEKYAKKEAIDILAVAKTKKNLLEKLLFGSVSQRLFYHTHIPLLIFQARDKFDLEK